MSYQQYVEITLNRDRAMLRRAYYESLAAAVAAGLDDVPMEMCRAATSDERTAGELFFGSNAGRAMARRKAR